MVKARIGTLLVDLLLSFGLDSGQIDTGFNPLMILAACWFSDHRHVGQHFNDELVFLLNKLVSHAQSDPFSHGQARILVYPSGLFGAIEFPGLANGSEKLTLEALNRLMRQDTWAIPWNAWQLIDAVSLGLEFFPEETKFFISFWVGNSLKGVKIYLDAKINLLALLLANHSRSNHDYYSLNAIDVIIESSGYIFALLSGNESPTEFRHPSLGQAQIRCNLGIPVIDESLKMDALTQYMIEALAMLPESPCFSSPQAVEHTSIDQSRNPSSTQLPDVVELNRGIRGL